VKAVILAGGYGTRLSEESSVRPKPMVEIGEKPLLWHIMKIYSAFGINDFVICCGYKSYVIKEYFSNYFLHTSNVTFDLRENTMTTHSSSVEPWRVTLIDTGYQTMTGGRLKRIQDHVGGETFCFTYGDAVGDVNIADLIEFHRGQGRLATLTAVQPPGRFGAVVLEEDKHEISSFMEKPEGDGAWINGGYFVLEPGVFEYIDGDATVWEREPLERLAHDGQLSAYRHRGYWQNMDTLRDKAVLEQEWASGNPAWTVWEPGRTPVTGRPIGGGIG
jgi:glucose-1-phosphate cytidylyltransferase